MSTQNLASQQALIQHLVCQCHKAADVSTITLGTMLQTLQIFNVGANNVNVLLLCWHKRLVLKPIQHICCCRL